MNASPAPLAATSTPVAGAPADVAHGVANDAVAVDVRGVEKRYGEVAALSGISLAIREREFFTLLGPSGCGKTTLLRILAGFETVSAGEVLLHGRPIADLPPHRRPVNTVFQSYALFPHLTVLENVRFGLEMKGAGTAEAGRRARAMLELVQLEDFAGRRPRQLSGGQQQRVALARALAPEPEVLLLDEPLSALDLKLRQAMRTELKRIQKDTGITFVFVTHDQEEALTMSDRIAVMSAGAVRQVGTPVEVYDRPADRFVAEFVGESNLLDAEVLAADGARVLCRLVGGGELEATVATSDVRPGSRGSVGIRPERLRPAPEGAVGNFRGRVEESVYLGTDTQLVVRLEGGGLVSVRCQSGTDGAIGRGPGTPIGIDVDPGAARFLAP